MQEAATYCVHTMHPLLRDLPAEARDRLQTALRRRRFRHGAVLFYEGDLGDELHLIEEGWVAIEVTTPLGDTGMLALLGPGDFFGEQALLAADARRTASATAVMPVTTTVLRRVDFVDLRMTFPETDDILLNALAAQVRRLSAQLIEAQYVPADQRVKRRLHHAATVFGAGSGDGVVPMTQEQVARMAGTTRATVGRVLGQLQDAQIVELGRGRVRVVDLARLNEVAYRS
jgi:CRP-like cAMP-binding protein